MNQVGEDAPPRELLVDTKPAPGDSSDGSGTAMAPIVMSAIGAGMLAKYVSPVVGLLALGVAVTALIVRAKPREGRYVLRVEDDVLEVTRERRASPLARIRLADLLDVTLDRQTRPATGRGGSATDRVRLAFERRGPDDSIFVPDERITPFEAQEWYSKVRVFLRKHGWVPEDERQA
jgi:hypothetical protein